MAGLVSCVMPVRAHGQLFDQAIWNFLRQDYEHRELVVVGDATLPVDADQLPCDPRIRYERVPAPAAPGVKRNEGCRLARGDLIAHWSEDAWYGPERLSLQVRQLESCRAAALSGVLHYQPLTGRLWRYDGPAGTRTGLPAATLAHRRSVWEEHPFDPSARNDVAAFLSAIPPRELAVDDGAGVAVVVLSGTGTGQVNPADARWRRRPYAELGRLLARDASFYAGLGGSRTTPAAGSALEPITVAATFVVYDGYGSMAEYLALGLARTGADVHVAPFRIDPAGMSAEFRALWARSRSEPSQVVLCHAWWGENLARFGRARDLFVKTAWESSRLPVDWPARLNLTRAVLVPSRFAAGVFRASGVEVPVEVVHEGVDPEVYPYVERPERPGITTLVVGVLAPRKNFRDAIAAWKLAFDDDPDARLILKARFQVDSYEPDDPRIRLVDTNEPTRGIAHWYERADVLLALGNEGFGLPLVEGMATGLPAVALNAEAQSDVCSEAEAMVLPVPPRDWAPVKHSLFGPSGVRALPDVKAAAGRLRWVAEHRREARAMGKRASGWAHARRNVWDMGPAVLAAMERHARTSRPLRRTAAMWAPDNGPAAFRYYADDLTRALSRVQRYDLPPRAWRSQSLHVQHSPRVFAEGHLTETVCAARAAGIGLVVTEHAVGVTATPWEQRADVLIALDEAAARRLRERWPSKRVELIPPALPAWREPTRDGSRRVVALIGSPSEAEKAELLSLRELAAVGREVELVRQVGLPGSSDRLASRLNTIADAVVVWRRGANDGTGMYVARVAVASGVPVVMSHASAPDGLDEVTLRRESVAEGVLEALEGEEERAARTAAARDLCAAWDWSRVAAVHDALWRTVST
jgi:glycosyltransferase involved in cell wall biosynthesis